MKIKIMALSVLMLMFSAFSADAAQFFHDGAELGHSEEVNCSTGIDCGKVSGKMVVSLEEPLPVNRITVSYYATLPYYTSLNWPGSGAPVGSMITRGGPTGNCGGGGNGTTVNVCVSDGTNFRLV